MEVDESDDLVPYVAWTIARQLSYKQAMIDSTNFFLPIFVLRSLILIHIFELLSDYYTVTFILHICFRLTEKSIFI